MGLGMLVFCRKHSQEVSALLWTIVRDINIQQDRFEEILARHIGMDSEITALAVSPSDSDRARLATGSCNKAVQVWNFNRANILTSIFSVVLEATVPIGLTFLDNAANNICVYGLFDGVM